MKIDTQYALQLADDNDEEGEIATTLRWAVVEIERLQMENKTLRELNLRRFISCITCGDIDEDKQEYIPRVWKWFCGICDARSESEDNKCNLIHEINRPLLTKEENEN